MKYSVRRSWPVAAVAMSLLFAACGSSSSTSSGKGKALRLGGLFSLTGAGAVYGPQQKNAVELAQDTVNAAGGVNGAMLQITVVDDGSAQTQSAQQMQTLIQQDGVLGVLGPTLSNSAVAADPVADSLKTPVVAVSNTGLNIVGTCPYPCTYIFRDSLGEASAIPTNIRTYVARAVPKPTTGVLLYPNDDKFSVDGATAVKQTLQDGSVGIRLLDTIQFSKNDTDLSSFVSQAVSKHPDVIFITSLGGIPAKVMTLARQDGFTGQFLGGNGFNSAAVSAQAGAAGAGAQSASAWYLNNTFPSNASFVSAYKARFGTDPDQFAAQAYAGVLIFVDAAKRAHLTYTNAAADRQAIDNALPATNIQTPLGPFQFTSQHDVRQTIWVLTMHGKGGFNLVKSVSPS